ATQTHWRGYFLWSLSDIMNATSIPKDIISVNELTMSIGEHLPPREVSQRRLTAERQCYLTPHAKPVYCKHCNIDWYNKDKLQQKDCTSGINIFKNKAKLLQNSI